MQRRIPSVLAAMALASVVFCIRAGGGEAAGGKAPDCVYVGTPNDVVAKMLAMAKITKDDVVYDPGCGDGRMVIAAARKYGCRGVGFEIVPKLVAEGRQIAKKRKVDHLVSIEDKDIYTVDYSKATVISMYLLPDMIVKLLPALEKMKPGSALINTARGDLVNEADLVWALEQGPLRAAALDVLGQEPPGPGHPFLARDDVLVTPHMGPHTAEATSAMGERALDDLLAVLSGRAPRYPI